MKKIILLCTILLMLSLVSASFDCTTTSNVGECTNILNSPLNASQQEVVLAALLYNDSWFPNHDLIFRYNTNIAVDATIENLTIANSQYIKNAWVSLLALMPSVLEANILYVPSNALVLSTYGYNISVPSNYVSSGYPSTLNGDCKTTYTLTENTPTLNLFVNNELQGHQKLQPVTIEEDSLIAAQFTVRTTIQQEHYQWKAYCRAWDRLGNCISYEYKCEHTNTEHLRDVLATQDQVMAQYYSRQPIAALTILDQYYNTTKLQFHAEHASGMRIAFANSSYHEQQYLYGIVFSKRPFYVITLEARPTHFQQAHNLLVGSNDTLYVADVRKCKLHVFNHFFSAQSDCQLVAKKEQKQLYQVIPFTHDLNPLLKLGALLFVLYLLYRIITYFVTRTIA